MGESILIKTSVVNAFKDCDIEVQVYKKLAEYTSFKIGGEADYIVKPKNFTELVCTINIANDNNIDYYFLGSGSNLLVSDKGYRGIIILTTLLDKISLLDETTIEAYCGATVSKLCKFAYENSLSGLEFAWGIPGSVGGGIYMNAGAYGGEFKNVIVSCKYINKDGKLCLIPISDLDMSYRHSFFSDSKLFILSTVIKLKKAGMDEIKQKMDEHLNSRKTKQPLEYPSCGSTFKRPQNGFASALIEECGLKGFRVGGAEVSTKHSGFIINVDNATCDDVLTLAKKVQEIVLDKKGITLELEVKTLGF